jgi:hypothetical protein
MTRSTQQPAAALTESSDPVAASTRLREAHFERNRLLGLGTLDAERARRLRELVQIIEAARCQFEQQHL